ncbi:MAG: hypothetical protein KDD38_09475, partial [Bdellovibrionales bacterium]|nr:hypothetical protein [Bdellovibrionales bacterium]
MKLKTVRPRKSLRTILMMWLLMFAIVPLAFITGYSLVKYERAIDQELVQRLIGNSREVQVIIQEFQKDLNQRTASNANDKSLIYYLSSNSISQARELATKWMKSHFTHHLSIFNREGRLEVALYRDAKGAIQRQSNLEGADVYLSEKFRERAKNENQLSIIEFTSDGALDLIVFSKITTASGVLVGYIEEILRIDQGFISSLKNRLNLELVFFSTEGDKLVSTHEDLTHYRQGFFLDKFKENKRTLFDLNIRD